jgi:hypothetical protein
VLFGGGAPQGVFGGSQVFTCGSLGLNNTGDTLSILDSDEKNIDQVTYGPEGNQNQSLTRYPDVTGLLPMIPHGEVPVGIGLLYSPGTTILGERFGK